MAGAKPRRLRRRVALPLMLAFALLWLGCMALLTGAEQDELELRLSTTVSDTRETLTSKWTQYQEQLEGRHAEDAGNLLRYNISTYSMALTDVSEGGMAFLIRDEAGEEFSSQLAWGYGCEEGFGVEPTWYLFFDEGLDDAGQMAFAKWLMGIRESSSFVLDSAGETALGAEDMLGCVARVSGFRLEGHALDVRKIEIIGPDGEVRSSFEAAAQGDGETVTLEFKYMQISSVLLPLKWSDGSDGRIDMERRLANYRRAQEMLEGAYVGTGGVRVSSSSYGSQRIAAFQADISGAAVDSLTFIYVCTLLLTAAAALGLAAYLSKKVTGPVEELCRGAEAGRCAVDGPVTELNALARAFNGAQERLAGQLEREREFTRAAAHELKTPLAVLRTHAEALREDIDAEKRGQYLDIVLDESDRMTRLVARLLELSRLEGGTVAKEPLELSALIREVWGPLELTMAQRGLKLELDLQEARVDGDRELLRQAVGNLAANALRHCADGGEIRVSLRAKDGEAILAVYNDGELVAEEDLPRLFEAFYRGDKSRSRESGGTGLGLAIVRAAALAHGGGCAVDNCECGVCFYVTLPVA